MANYANMQATALRLIKANGRIATLRKRSTTPADPTIPWRARDKTQDTTVQVSIVEGKNDLKNTPGNDLVRRETMTFLVAYTDANEDLTQFSQLVDGGKVYEITEVKSISPGPVVVAYRITVKM